MADPRARIFASVVKRQASVDPAVGDAFLRDGEPLIVTAVGDDRVAWRTASGLDQTGSLEAFRSRAVEPIETEGGGANYLDNVWQLASSAGIARDVRSMAVQRAARRAPSEPDRLTVRRWASTLAGGMEPTRV